MNVEDSTAIASRLCAACGMCCDGTMFQIVRMQPGDSAAELGRLGLKIRCRDGEFFMEQPCSALKEMKCTIYEKRPTRCRLFHCQQLRRVETGDATESEATAMIVETRELVECVRGLIEQSGLREDGQALPERFERVMATPVDVKLEPEMAAVREDLGNAMQKLRMRINREFRPPPGAE
ncbi:YkgJ family cysteine cluster protein [Prosthecobacter sp.]|uniref:YkgJ family cysteine cluster protein n=1 Tax=Prosthecobacter sp. TaxID=1965333 RepID=UPI002ABCDE0D|nr:YkgJ family cysteine cluster protein [Prosthecobacter sp.]MDZ4404241.1 YkgJ family cysteine cluster protein [Prosthecobacter sp.]